jgi:hypothetical protein
LANGQCSHQTATALLDVCIAVILVIVWAFITPLEHTRSNYLICVRRDQSVLYIPSEDIALPNLLPIDQVRR